MLPVGANFLYGKRVVASELINYWEIPNCPIYGIYGSWI